MKEEKKQEQKEAKKKERKEKEKVKKEEPKIKIKKYEGPVYGYLQKKNNINKIYKVEEGSDKKLQNSIIKYIKN